MQTLQSICETMGVLALAGALLNATLASAAPSELGVFSDHGDVGKPGKPGAVGFDAAKGAYRLSGGGANMWFTNDAFHYLWKSMSGDLTLAADIGWVGTNGNPHRKACLVIRQTLDPESAYVDAALHGVGLTSLQFRDTAGGQTREIQSNVSAPGRLRIEKRGNYVSISVGSAGEAPKPAGAAVRIQFKEPFYVGLAVCAHDNNALETAVFSNVEISTATPAADAGFTVQSALEVIALSSLDRRVIYHTPDHIEAPNWSRDGQYFLFNRNGRICKIPVTGGEPQVLDTGSATRCNNDHGISPDGTQLAISDQTGGGNQSRISLIPISGGTPKLITPAGPSYWHGWSPDGKTLAYCAQRSGEFDVYTMPAEGGEEKRLTTATGLDDGPEYSPDGQFIYFNSDRGGSMQIWRMKADGTEQTQLTSDDYHNWFAHPSPDGRWLVFLSFTKDVRSNDHPANKDVVLRLMPAGGGEIRVLAKLFGGQGTINVPSWSPDSRQVAFVSYQRVYP
jgi:TolB protein